MLNFKVGDRVTVDQSYVSNVLTTLPQDAKLVRTIQLLQLLGSETAVITNIGFIKVEHQITSGPLPIHLFPVRSSNPLFQGGSGTRIYLPSEENINNTLIKVA